MNELTNLCQNQTFLMGFRSGMGLETMSNPHKEGTERYRLFNAGVEYATMPLGVME